MVSFDFRFLMILSFTLIKQTRDYCFYTCILSGVSKSGVSLNGGVSPISTHHDRIISSENKLSEYVGCEYH